MVQSKKNTLNKSKHQWRKTLHQLANQKSHDLRGKKCISYLKVTHPMESWLGYQGFSVTIPGKKIASNHINQKTHVKKRVNQCPLPGAAVLFSFWQQKATQVTTGSRSSFSSSLRRKGRSRSKSRPRWK